MPSCDQAGPVIVAAAKLQFRCRTSEVAILLVAVRLVVGTEEHVIVVRLVEDIAAVLILHFAIVIGADRLVCIDASPGIKVKAS